MADDEPAVDPSPDETVTLEWPHSLYLCVGAVAVMGAKVEGSMVGLLRHLDPSRLSQPHTDVTWDSIERALRTLLPNLDAEVAAEVLAALDWADGLDLRGRRNRAVHDQHPVIPWNTHVHSVQIARRQRGVIVVAPHEQFLTHLQETADLLLRFAARLDDLTYWATDPVRRRLPLLPPK